MRFVKSILEVMAIGCGTVGVGGLGGAIDNNSSWIEPVGYLGITIVLVAIVTLMKKYREWKDAESKRIKKCIRIRNNRFHDASRLYGM